MKYSATLPNLMIPTSERSDNKTRGLAIWTIGRTGFFNSIKLSLPFPRKDRYYSSLMLSSWKLTSLSGKLAKASGKRRNSALFSLLPLSSLSVWSGVCAGSLIINGKENSYSRLSAERGKQHQCRKRTAGRYKRTLSHWPRLPMHKQVMGRNSIVS